LERPGPLLILLVDDDEFDRESARRGLLVDLEGNSSRFEVREASSLSEARDLISHQRFDALVLDSQLTDGDGLSLLRELRSEGNLTPVVVLTGQARVELAVDLIKAGASDCLVKQSYASSELQRVVHSAVKVERAERRAGHREAALREAQQRLLLHMDNSPLAVIEFDRNLRVSRWSLQSSKLFGWTEVDTVGSKAAELPILHPEDCENVLAHLERLRSGGEANSRFACRVVTGDRQVLHCEWHLSALHDNNGRLLSVLSLIEDQTESWRARQRLVESEARFREQAEREAVINEIGKTLRGSLDEGEILRLATRKVGELLKVDRCLWAWVQPAEDRLEVSAHQYVDGVEPFARRFPLSMYPHTQREAFRKGDSLVMEDTRLETELREMRDELSIRALVAAPVFLRGEWRGLFTVQQSEPRVWSRAELDLMRAAADMLAPALDNARLYARQYRVAEMLQRTFLSDLPPELGGLRLAHTYRAVMEESRVGGDFYDVIPLPGGRVGLVIGDVSGKGLTAALQTGTVKTSLRAFALEDGRPDRVMFRLNQVLLQEASGLGEHFVTLFFAIYDPTDSSLTYVNAGHEPQVLKRAAGGVLELPPSGASLGILTTAEYVARQEFMESGDSLILFTDGLTEARQRESRELFSLERVVETCSQLDAELCPEEIADRLGQEAMRWAEGVLHDDLALLVARRVEFVPPARPARAASINPDHDGLLSAVSAWVSSAASGTPEDLRRATPKPG
jgi:PAS domain S-box-containing protein